MRRHELCLLAFPRGWRERYGPEVLALIAEQSPSGSASLDLLRAGLVERTRIAGPTVLRRAAATAPIVLAAVIGTSAARSSQTTIRSAGVGVTAASTAPAAPTVTRRSEPAPRRRAATHGDRPSAALAVRVRSGVRHDITVAPAIVVRRVTHPRTFALTAPEPRRVTRPEGGRALDRVAQPALRIRRLVRRRPRVTPVVVRRATSS